MGKRVPGPYMPPPPAPDAQSLQIARRQQQLETRLQKLMWLAEQHPEEGPRCMRLALKLCEAPINQYSLQTDQFHPPAPEDFIQPIMAPSRFMVLPEVPLIAADDESAPITLRFSAGGGWLIGWRVSVVDPGPPAGSGQLEMSQLGIQMFLNDGEQLITDGVNQAFASAETLFADAMHWSPIMRRVGQKTTLTVTYANFNAAPGPVLVPRMTFAYWRCYSDASSDES